MRKIILFMMVSLDGFFEGPNHDLSWHNVDAEFNSFAAKQMQEAGMILFGRKTYKLMEGYWPSYKPEDEDNRIIREQLDTLPKIVYSKTMNKVHESKNWQHVTLVREIHANEINKLKAQKGKAIFVLGSSKLCVSLLQEKLLDELRIMINPVVIGKGTRLFEGITKTHHLTLFDARTFHNGNILLQYKVAYD